MALQDRGEKITDIARQYHVSRQTIYSQIKRAYNFSDDPDVKMRMNFMNHDDLCTTIDIDFRHEKIKIKNYTDQIIFRAFGVVTDPDWADLNISGRTLFSQNTRSQERYSERDGDFQFMIRY